MRSDVVVGSSEGIEEALLKAEVGGGGLDGSSFEGSVHAFMSAVLLWISRSDALVCDTELEPPNIQPSQAVDAGRSKGGAVIAANGIGESMLTKQLQKLSVDALGSHVRQCFATQQVTTEVVDNRQGIAVETISGEELAFEIDGPNLVGSGGVEGSCSGMLPAAASSARPNAVMPLENVENRAARRQSPVGKTLLESLQDLPSAPTVPAVLVENPLDELIGSLMRARPRCPTAVVQPTDSALAEAVEPLVAGDPADAIAMAKAPSSPSCHFRCLEQNGVVRALDWSPSRPFHFPPLRVRGKC